ncbi:MAG: GNAT family N-acetyltransferase [Maribacter sp.]|jgi:predicted GNAT superfamily acetyltransferase
MKTYYAKASSNEELRQILTLQKRNVITSITKKEKEEEGFVTVSHSLDVLKRMNDVCPHIVAKSNDEVIGYVLSMAPNFREEIPILSPMFKELEDLGRTNYLVMGQVCVERNHRKKGVFRGLYEAMKREYSLLYDTIITEVDTTNTRSLNAHYAIGFELLHNYESFGQNWTIIQLPTND